MLFAYGPTEEGIFVGVDDSCFLRVNLVDLIKSAFFESKLWFLDLDDCLASSPAKIIAKKAIGASHFDLKYLQWVAKTGIQLVRRGKTAESETWKDYINSFLRSEEALEEIKGLIDEGLVDRTLYPGVDDMIRLMGDSGKILVTRNIDPIAKAYAERLNLRTYLEVDNKGGVVRDVVCSFSRTQFPGKISVMGDSKEDLDLVFAARFFDHSPNMFYVLDSSNSKALIPFCTPGTIVYTSKDRRGLVEVLTK